MPENFACNGAVYIGILTLTEAKAFGGMVVFIKNPLAMGTPDQAHERLNVPRTVANDPDIDGKLSIRGGTMTVSA
jgi:hypothetical protein